MKYSTRQAAKILGLHYTTFHKYLREKKLPPPEVTRVGGVRVRLWSESDLERVRKTLPKIANGRKTRYQKLRDKQKTQPRASQPQHAKPARAGGPGAALQKPLKKKKK